MDEHTHDEQTAMENVGRIVARGLVIGGGLFWIIAAFSGPYVYHEMSLIDSLATAVWPFMAAVVTLIVGWTYERLAAVLLFGATAAVFVWGFLYAWELGVWLLMAFVLIGPMVTAGLFFLLAARAEYNRTHPIEPRRSLAAPEPARPAAGRPATPRPAANVRVHTR